MWHRSSSKAALGAPFVSQASAGDPRPGQRLPKSAPRAPRVSQASERALLGPTIDWIKLIPTPSPTRVDFDDLSSPSWSKSGQRCEAEGDFWQLGCCWGLRQGLLLGLASLGAAAVNTSAPSADDSRRSWRPPQLPNSPAFAQQLSNSGSRDSEQLRPTWANLGQSLADLAQWFADVCQI